MAAHDDEYAVWSELDMDPRTRAPAASWVSGAIPPAGHLPPASKPEPIPMIASQSHAMPHAAHPPHTASLMASGGISAGIVSSHMGTHPMAPAMHSAPQPSAYAHQQQPPLYTFPPLGVSMTPTDASNRTLAAPQLPASHALSGRQDAFLSPLPTFGVGAHSKPDPSVWGVGTQSKAEPGVWGVGAQSKAEPSMWGRHPPPHPHHAQLDMPRLPPQQQMYGRSAAAPAQPPTGSTAGAYAPAYSAFSSFVSGDANAGAPDIALHEVGGGNAHPGDVLSKARASLVSGVSDDVHASAGVVGEPGLGAFGGQAETATSSSVRSVGGVLGVGINGAAVGALNGIIKTKQRRRYAKPKSSKYCHLCARHERAVTMYPCGNVDLGICQKSVCAKCFETHGLDMNAARAPRVASSPRWTCPHCQGCCPTKAKCHSYDRQTERRRLKTRELKRQLAMKVQVAREATSA